MKTVIVNLESKSAYSQSRYYDKEDVKPLAKETHDAYERRTWQNRAHLNTDGKIFIPGSQILNALKDSAKRLKLQIPGKGRLEYTKYFEAGVMVTDDIVLPATFAKGVTCDKRHVPSDGRAGGGKRVIK